MANKKEKNEKKKRVNKTLPAIIALGGIIVLGFLIYIVAMKPNFTGNVVLDSSNNIAKVKNCRDVQVPYEIQEEYIKTEYYTERVPETVTKCDDEPLVYKLTKGECKQMVDRLVFENEPAKYSCTIENLDSKGGSFSITIGFNVQGQKLEETQTEYLYPESSKTFAITRMVEKNSCYCYEKDIPTKQICRDVVEYRDVQRERQVTAYKPVTKYKTERKCN